MLRYYTPTLSLHVLSPTLSTYASNFLFILGLQSAATHLQGA